MNTISSERLVSWFVLRSVPGVGNLLFRRLIDHFRTPEAVLSADADALGGITGVSPRIASAIENHQVTDAVRHELELLNQSHFQVIPLTSPDYPPLLREIPDPPPFLYIYGSLAQLPPTIAIVGTRGPTSYGVRAARYLADQLCRNGIAVVSGMARGIDTEAHTTAVNAGGKTIAVLGSGLERIYPEENAGLFHRIAEKGAVVSEFHLRANPDPFRFPIRNRIISGLSHGVIVIEAARKSGALITARMAGEQGREVFAIPGSIFSKKSEGTHTLIRQGAKLVEGLSDILDELPQLRDYTESMIPQSRRKKNYSDRQLPLMPTPLPLNLTDAEQTVYKALSHAPIHIDDLTRQLKIEIAELSAILLQLELKGAITQLPGKQFVLTKQTG